MSNSKVPADIVTPAREQKRLLITGATGFIGTAFTLKALAEGWQVTVISRRPSVAAAKFDHKVRVLNSPLELADDEHIDAIVHLAGANVFALPWFAARKQTLLHSRLRLADTLLAFVRRAKRPPSTWLQASAVGIYPTRSDLALDETSASGQGFAVTLCQAIEERVAAASALGMRAVALRLGLVLGQGGGVFPAMRLATRLSGGAVIGKGTQHVAWVHLADVVEIMIRAIVDARFSGPINVVAPDAPTYQQFTESLAAATHRKVIWRVPEFVMKLSLGERAPLLLEGAKILPAQLAKLGYPFRFSLLNDAFADLSK